MLTQKMFERVVNQTIALAAAAEEAEQKRGARRQGRHGGRRALSCLRAPCVARVLIRVFRALQGPERRRG